jgi:hypothetical protein
VKTIRISHLKRLSLALGVLACLHSGALAFELGVTTHVGQNVQGRLPTIDALQALGVTAIRDEAFWAKLEQTPGRFEINADLEQFARFVPEWGGTGGRTMLIATYGNRAYGDDRYPLSERGRAAYARYARFLVDRFGKDISYLEVWNEWNRGFGMGEASKHKANAENYVKALEEVARAMPQGRDRPRLVAGAVEGRDDAWIDEFVRLGGLRTADFLSLHPYVHHADEPPEAAMRWLDRLHERLRRRSPDRVPPFLITEIGWPVGTGARHVDEETAASYLVRFLLLARSRPWIEGVWWYSLELSSNERSRFSLVRPGGRRTAAFEAFRMLAPYIRAARGATQEMLPNGVYRVSLELDSGRYLSAFWIENERRSAKRMSLRPPAWDATVVAWRRADTSNDRVDDLSISSTPLLVEHGREPPSVTDAGGSTRRFAPVGETVAVKRLTPHE